MTWTVTKEEAEGTPSNVNSAGTVISTEAKFPVVPAKLHVRAIIDIDNEQAEIKELIASLQKHVKEEVDVDGQTKTS